MTYEEAVERTAAALDRGEVSNWEVAQLTYEFTISGAGRPATDGRLGNKATMKRWCDDVVAKGIKTAFSTTSGEYYKAVWVRFGIPHLGGEFPSFFQCYQTVKGDDRGSRFEQWDGGSLLKRGSPASKVQTFVALANDEAILTSSEASQAARAVREEAIRREFAREFGRAREQAASPIDERREALDQGTADVKAFFTIEEALAVLTKAVERFERQIEGPIQTTPPGDASFAFIGAELARAEAAIRRVRHWIAGGSSDVDQFVSSVLKEG